MMAIPNDLRPWYWRSLPLAEKTGSTVFEQLFLEPGKIAVLLESPFPPSPDSPQCSRYSICAGEPRQLEGKLQLWRPPVGQILILLKQLQQRQSQQTNNYPINLPFTGGWLGWLGYDFAWEIEQLPQHNSDPLPFPVAFWYEPENFAVLDHAQQQLWLAATLPSELDRLQSHLENPTRADRASYFPSIASQLSFFSTQNEYETAVRQAKRYIGAGDIFQANLSLRFQAATSSEAWPLYRRLQTINPSPFASYWQTPWGNVISCSPERLVQLNHHWAQTRPIAGTRPRGKTFMIEQQFHQELLTNTKERAEHIMLVDLERNDLGRVCHWGTVEVDELLMVERYSHVMHLVSNIRGQLREDQTPVDLIAALFPGGTITGCPKVRCMEIIEELEPFRRNLFYGSCGYLDWRGNLDLNILIRTLLHAKNPAQSPDFQVWGQVGAGIVADSDPQREWQESLHKAEAQLAALQILN